jgi:hypothetical protein
VHREPLPTTAGPGESSDFDAVIVGAGFAAHGASTMISFWVWWTGSHQLRHISALSAFKE